MIDGEDGDTLRPNDLAPILIGGEGEPMANAHKVIKEARDEIAREILGDGERPESIRDIMAETEGEIDRMNMSDGLRYTGTDANANPGVAYAEIETRRAEAEERSRAYKSAQDAKRDARATMRELLPQAAEELLRTKPAEVAGDGERVAWAHAVAAVYREITADA